MTKKQILDELRKLPPAERTELAFNVWKMVDATGLPSSPEMQAELNRRLEAHRATPAPTEHWDDYRARVSRGEI